MNGHGGKRPGAGGKPTCLCRKRGVCLHRRAQQRYDVRKAEALGARPPVSDEELDARAARWLAALR